MAKTSKSTLTKIVAPALFAALSIGAVLPATASAAPRYTPVREASVRADINQLAANIDRAAARRTISQREAASLKREARDVRAMYQSYSRNGLSARETQTLRAKVDRIQFALRAERRDRDGRRG